MEAGRPSRDSEVGARNSDDEQGDDEKRSGDVVKTKRASLHYKLRNAIQSYSDSSYY